ncbi:MAG: phosphatase PAP2 family protein [Planctomycetaceae bacterium]|jgi:membrane-associated phospholipid phosphatase|nr:phosphatase PAP2 family protein [Planctomycetaceae bacterium]
MNNKIFQLYLQFIAIVFCGLILAVICNRFLDYPISSWFCVNQFNIIDKNNNVTKNHDSVESAEPAESVEPVESVESVESEVVTEPVAGDVGGKLFKRLAGWILILEFFGHPLCFFVILFLCFLLDPNRRRCLVRFIFSVLTSQTAIVAIKFSIHRKRPVINDFTSNSFDLSGFIGLDDIHSFPSGHTALAVILALALAWNYPRGRYLFYLLAVGVAFERIFDCRHYLSDTVIGGLIAYIVWFFCYRSSFIAKAFNCFESISDADSDLNPNKCNKKDKQPTLSFGTSSLGSVTNKRFSSGIHQFLKANDKQIDHKTPQQSPTPTPTPTPTSSPPVISNNSNKDNSNNSNNSNNNESNNLAVVDSKDSESHEPRSKSELPNSLRNRRRHNLPFDNFKK